MPNFDVEEVSLQSIWGEQTHLSVRIIGQFVEQSSGWLVGTVCLSNLFQFLKKYQKQTGNLDKLYDKNVRQFLGGRKKINKGIADTLTESPENLDYTTMASRLLYRNIESSLMTVLSPMLS